MHLLRNTLENLAANLAFDEAMVELADLRHESDEGFVELLRLWEMPKKCVVLGRASKWEIEVNHTACEQDSVPVLRRMSGGATIVAGPGCLMYSVLLNTNQRPALRMLDVAHREVMTRIRDASQAALIELNLPGEIVLQGTCDLTIDNRKFSGNALRCKRNWMLYHGTIMISMPLEWVSTYLRQPPRQPDYRQNRTHDAFVTRLLNDQPVATHSLFRATLELQLAKAWNAVDGDAPSDLCAKIDQHCKMLMETRYNDPSWHRGPITQIS